MDDADFSRIKDVNTLLEISLEFEKDTILFYEMIKDFVETRGQPLTLTSICCISLILFFIDRFFIGPSENLFLICDTAE